MSRGCFVGIDVSKAWLDVPGRSDPSGAANDPDGMMKRLPLMAGAGKVALPSRTFTGVAVRRYHPGHRTSTFEAVAQAVTVLEGEATAEPLFEFYRRAIGQMLRRVVGCDRPARVRRTMERWLRRNEEARFYHWKRRNRLPPRRLRGLSGRQERLRECAKQLEVAQPAQERPRPGGEDILPPPSCEVRPE